MKGLMIKDFKLIKSSLPFILFVILLELAILTFNNDFSPIEDSSTIIGFISFIGMTVAVRTIDMDGYDNCNTFLFSLPFSRKTYICEKYGFSILVALISWFISTLLVFSIGLIKFPANLSEILLSALTILLVILIFVSFMIPIELYFGPDKSRLFITVFILSLIFIGFILMRTFQSTELLQNHLLSFVQSFQLEHKLPIIFVLLFVIAFGILFISYKISLSILLKKDF